MCLRCSLLLLFTLYVHTKAQTTSAFELGSDGLGMYRIVCIYNHKQYFRLGHRASSINPKLCTHINYEFAHLDKNTHEMKSGLEAVDIGQNMYQEAVDLKKVNSKLKVMLSLGGWEDSTRKYSDLMSVAAKVDNFINKAVVYLKHHGFDGLDIAFEYPSCWQGDCASGRNDKENFSEFLEKLRKRFDKEGLILSVSVSSIKREIEKGYDVKAISISVHFINVMTYDMHGPWEPVTGHHTQWDFIPGDKDRYCNTKSAMEVWHQKGADKSKLNCGMATYAKTYTLKNVSDHRIGAPSKGAGRPGPVSKESGFLCFSEICQYLNAGIWTEERLNPAGFYAFSGDQWACYDPSMMAVEKTKWVVDQEYGGILIKDLSCDDFKGICFGEPYVLTEMINMEMKHRVKKKEKEKARATGK